jgi:hypothetical protein
VYYSKYIFPVVSIDRAYNIKMSRIVDIYRLNIKRVNDK